MTEHLRLRPIDDVAERERVVAAVFADPHEITLEDLRQLHVDGGTEDDAKRAFIDGKILLLAETHAGAPIYLVSVAPGGATQTAMTPLLDQHRFELTKLLARSREHYRRRFLGAWTLCSAEDWRARWVRFIGFEHAGVIPRDGRADLVRLEVKEA